MRTRSMPVEATSTSPDVPWPRHGGGTWTRPCPPPGGDAASAGHGFRSSLHWRLEGRRAVPGFTVMREVALAPMRHIANNTKRQAHRLATPRGAPVGTAITGESDASPLDLANHAGGCGFGARAPGSRG